MYEDRRKIAPTGLLTQNTTPRYTPKQVSFGLPTNVTKPAPNWVNPDKAKLEAERRYKEQMKQQKEASGGGSVICTRMFELGYMPARIYVADTLYGESLPRKFKAWYLRNASPIATKLQSRSIMTSIFWHTLVRPWAEEMAYQKGALKHGNRFGRMVMWLGFKLFEITK